MLAGIASFTPRFPDKVLIGSDAFSRARPKPRHMTALEQAPKLQATHWIGITPFALRRPAAGQRYGVGKVRSSLFSPAAPAGKGLPLVTSL